jgi:hypothetical protein
MQIMPGLINFVTIATLLLALLARPAIAAPEEYDLARLQSGEIMLQTIHGDRPGGAARVTALFYTTADAVWEVIGDCRFEFIYVRGLKVCISLLKRSGNRVILVKPTLLMGIFVYSKGCGAWFHWKMAMVSL